MSVHVIVLSRDQRSSTWAPWPGCVVPWLQTVTVASKPLPGRALGGALTAETTRSGRWPTPMTAKAAALLPSISSKTALPASAIAPRW
ncbi:hypothetical protein SCE1572_25235 [Sorangium cellulosum So0157-2]|uniref:Uncharacterized protein n=1 Tax=Sorangium cellulosum So0157-2 TaxID=1254432 RepID=S4Y3R2_SORCE|nr:hypothetical protein SCE1572_25235 [Sorangium cellulosum So0157-2]